MATSGSLTALGKHLATLPVDVRVGKMLIYAAMLGCLDPVRRGESRFAYEIYHDGYLLLSLGGFDI